MTSGRRHRSGDMDNDHVAVHFIIPIRCMHLRAKLRSQPAIPPVCALKSNSSQNESPGQNPGGVSLLRIFAKSVQNPLPPAQDALQFGSGAN